MGTHQRVRLLAAALSPEAPAGERQRLHSQATAIGCWVRMQVVGLVSGLAMPTVCAISLALSRHIPLMLHVAGVQQLCSCRWARTPMEGQSWFSIMAARYLTFKSREVDLGPLSVRRPK